MTWIIADETASLFLQRPIGDLIAAIFMVGLVAFLLISLIGYTWHQFRKTDAEASLKHEMIQRGMSADEIERVLAAKLSGAADRRTLPYPYVAVAREVVTRL